MFANPATAGVNNLPGLPNTNVGASPAAITQAPYVAVAPISGPGVGIGGSVSPNLLAGVGGVSTAAYGTQSSDDLVSSAILTAKNALEQQTLISRMMDELKRRHAEVKELRDRTLLQWDMELKKFHLDMRNIQMELNARQADYNKLTQQVALQQRVAYLAALRGTPLVINGGHESRSSSSTSRRNNQPFYYDEP